MKFSALLAVFAGIASASNHIPSQKDFEVIANTLKNAFAQVQANELAARPSEPDACWKQFGKKPDEPSEPEYVTECGAGLEASMGRCYEKCRVGFKGFGPFCLMTSGGSKLVEQSVDVLAATSYQRDPVSLDAKAICPASSLAINDYCIQAACPSKLPFTCGILCTKDGSQCTNIIATIATELFQLYEQLQGGNLFAAVQTLQKLWKEIGGWPKCDEMGDKLAFEEILNFVKMI